MRLKYLLLLSMSAILSHSCQKENNPPAKEECLVEVNGTFVLMGLDQAPEYLDGGMEGLARNVLSIIVYPADARENSIEGTVLLEYEITEIGTVENIGIAQDIGFGCGDASSLALAEATTGTSFLPAMLDENPVRVKKEISVKFKLE